MSWYSNIQSWPNDLSSWEGEGMYLIYAPWMDGFKTNNSWRPEKEKTGWLCMCTVCLFFFGGEGN